MPSNVYQTGKGIGAAVILYNPDAANLVDNINSFLPVATNVFIIDNSDNGADHHFLQAINDRIIYLNNNGNLGIAAALNIASKAAIDKGYTWLLTMDQDSFFDVANMELYVQQFFENFYNDDTIAIVSPSTEKDTTLPVLKFGVHSITSGSIINLTIYKATGGFEDALFIDEVDEDYCCKVLSHGYQVVRISNVVMGHKLGEKRRTGILNVLFVKERTIHQPFRVYYMVRNYFYIRKKYRKIFPELFNRRDGEFITDLKNNVLFSGNFIIAAWQAIKGYWHFVSNKL